MIKWMLSLVVVLLIVVGVAAVGAMMDVNKLTKDMQAMELEIHYLQNDFNAHVQNYHIVIAELTKKIDTNNSKIKTVDEVLTNPSKPLVKTCENDDVMHKTAACIKLRTAAEVHDAITHKKKSKN